MASIVLDTNVLVAGLRSRLGASARLLTLVGRGLVEINVSVPVMLEYEAVLKRPRVVPAFIARDIEALLDGLCALARRRQIFYLWRPQLSDAGDDAILELAVAAEHAPIVTYNGADFRQAASLGVRVLTPRELLYEIGAIGALR